VRRIRSILAAALLALTAAAPAWSQGLQATEHQVKAAFVLNFTRFVEWPSSAFASPQAALVLCTNAREGLGDAVAALEGRRVHGRDLKVRRTPRGEDLRGCHVLLVVDPEDRRPADWIKLPPGQPTLTVGDVDGFTEAGGMIGLVPAGNRLQFDVNLGASSRAGLQLSSQLLRLARNVRGERG